MGPMASEISAPVDGLSGLVERVTFHNEDTGFAVLKVKVKGRRDLIPVVGVVATVSPGEWITAEGALGAQPRPWNAAARDGDPLPRPDIARGH